MSEEINNEVVVETVSSEPVVEQVPLLSAAEPEVVAEEPEVVAEEPVEGNEEESGSMLTGSAIFGDEGIFSGKTLYYIFGGVLALGILFFGFKFIKKRKPSLKNIKIRKLSDLKPKKDETEEDKRITDAEEKLKQAQEEINSLKNQGKIKALEEKMEADRKELQRLKEGKE